MNTLFSFGRTLYAVAILSLGLLLLITRNFPTALFPLPAAFPGRSALVIGLGVVFVLAGLSLLMLRKADSSSLLLGILWLLVMFTLHLPALVSNPYNASKWTVIFELVALSGGGFYLAGELGPLLGKPINRRFTLITVGRLLFAGSLVIFGVLHFLYAAFIATLIPSWVPGQLFWAYFVGVGFLATAISLLLQKQMSLATHLLGSMFLLWVIILHAPRAVAKPHVEPEWTSLLIALAMSGISFSMTRLASQKEWSLG